MRTLANKVFAGIEPFLLGDSDSPGAEHPALIGEVLLQTLRYYRPFPTRTLGIDALYAFNRLCQRLSVEAPQYDFTEDDYAVLLTVCEWTLPRAPWFRQGPAVMDTLKAAEEKP